MDFLYCEIHKLINLCISTKGMDMVTNVYIDIMSIYMNIDGFTLEDFKYRISVVFVLAEMHLDYEVLVAGLLYNPNLTLLSNRNIRTRYGSNIADILLECDESQYITEAHENIASCISMLISTLKDRRVILILLSHCINTLRTQKGKKDIASLAMKALHFYSHIAYKLGLDELKVEIEDRAFQELYPSRYAIILNALNHTIRNNGRDLYYVIYILKKYLKSCVNYVSYHITGRLKKPYSIYRKMHRRQLSFESIKDIYAYRILVDSVDACYIILGKLHSLFTPIMGYFKDYIGNPKTNGYKALHNTFFGPYELILEVQITTKQMYSESTSGNASHHLYKDNVQDQHKQNVSILHNLKLLQDDLVLNNPLLRGNGIYVITPKKKIIGLPKDATILDLAYSIHTSLGRQAHYGLVNNRRNRIDYKLHNGDMVEIITSSNISINHNCLSFTVTTKAKKDIKRYLKQQSPTTIETKYTYQAPNPNRMYHLCKYCSPVYNETQCHLDLENKIHLSNCPLLLAVDSNFDWSCTKDVNSYITSLYIYYSKQFNTQSIITILVNSEIHLVNFVIYNDHVKVLIDITHIDQLSSVVNEFSSLKNINSVTRLPAQGVSIPI
jgi:(p)ppGpp synthase/HD superfamily hydrolase